MMPLNVAKEFLTETFDSAFSKSLGTTEQRVAFANRCCSQAPTDSNDSVMLLVWATDYCQNWTAPEA